jgi:hypothetical protein
MNHLNFLLLIVFLAIVSSCEQEDIAISYMDSSQLLKVHSKVIIDLNSNSSEELIDIGTFNKEVSKNLEITRQIGIEELLEENGFNPFLYDAYKFYQENKSDTKIYGALSSSFQFDEKSAYDLFLLIEIENALQEEYNQILHLKSGFGCAVAIAGSIVVTASAVTIGSAAAPGAGTALGFWLAGKVIATIGIIDSCGEL